MIFLELILNYILFQMIMQKWAIINEVLMKN
jgi:hypothetical protein